MFQASYWAAVTSLVTFSLFTGAYCWRLLQWRQPDWGVDITHFKYDCARYRAAFLTGCARLLLASLHRFRVLLRYCKEKEKNKKLSPNDISSLAFWKSTTCTHTCFARLSGESGRQLTLYLLEQIIQCSNFQNMIFSINWWTKKRCSTDRRSEPLQSFHLEHLAADVSVALRVFFWPTIPENRCKPRAQALFFSILPPGAPRCELQPVTQEFELMFFCLDIVLIMDNSALYIFFT